MTGKRLVLEALGKQCWQACWLKYSRMQKRGDRLGGEWYHCQTSEHFLGYVGLEFIKQMMLLEKKKPQTEVWISGERSGLGIRTGEFSISVTHAQGKCESYKQGLGFSLRNGRWWLLGRWWFLMSNCAPLKLSNCPVMVHDGFRPAKVIDYLMSTFSASRVKCIHIIFDVFCVRCK